MFKVVPTVIRSARPAITGKVKLSLIHPLPAASIGVTHHHFESNQDMDAAAFTSDTIVSATLFQYSSLPFAPQPGKHTVLASFALHDTHSGRVQLLSLGAGVKCLPASRLPVRGDALHDSHAEVIARRGAIRWLLEEVQRDARARLEEGQNEHSATASASLSAWVCARDDGLYALRDNVHLWMYASTVPCAYNYRQ